MNDWLEIREKQNSLDTLESSQSLDLISNVLVLSLLSIKKSLCKGLYLKALIINQNYDLVGYEPIEAIL